MIAEGFPYLFFVKNAQFSGKSVFCAAKTPNFREKVSFVRQKRAKCV